jgi:Holliday junction resolvase RusA-like endonuclease
MDFRIELSPVAASRPRLNRYGNGTHYEGAYKTFKLDVDPLMQQTFKGLTGDIPGGPLDVWLRMYVTRPKNTSLQYPKADIDNFMKAILDAANGYAWKDDCQIVDIHAIKRWSAPGETGWFSVKVAEHDPQYD